MKDVRTTEVEEKPFIPGFKRNLMHGINPLPCAIVDAEIRTAEARRRLAALQAKQKEVNERAKRLPGLGA